MPGCHIGRTMTFPPTDALRHTSQKRATSEQRIAEKKVNMFSHLDDYKRGLLPSATKVCRSPHSVGMPFPERCRIVFLEDE